MKKVLDRVWEWMKSTAWFQVVLLVGVVVAIVLSISPITNAISEAIADNERSKYIENNKLNYDELMTKVNDIESTGEEFAVIFGNPAADSVSNLGKGIDLYEAEKDSVKIYIVNTQVTEENHSTYDMDEDWYNYYKLSKANLNFFYEATKEVYEVWKDYCVSNSNEILQTAEYGSSLPSPALVWFRTNDHISSYFKDDSGNVKTTLDTTTNTQINFHAAKVYTAIQASGDNDGTNTLTGLDKFFGTSEII